MDGPRRGARLPDILEQQQQQQHEATGSETSSRPTRGLDVARASSHPSPFLGSSASSSSSWSSSSIPMAIPHATTTQPQPPPPLPPPRYVPGVADGGPDVGWQWANRLVDRNRPGGRPPGAYPGQPTNVPIRGSLAAEAYSDEQRPEMRRRGSSATVIAQQQQQQHLFHSDPPRSPPITTHHDASFGSLPGQSTTSSHSIAGQSPQSGFSSSVHDAFRSTASAYDQSLVQKLNTRRETESRTPPRSLPQGLLSPTTHEPAVPQRHPGDGPPLLKPLSLPSFTSGRTMLTDSPSSRWADTPLTSAISPRTAFPLRGGPAPGAHAPRDPHEQDRVQGAQHPRQVYPHTTGSVADENRRSDRFHARTSPDHDMEFTMDDASIKRLHLEDPGRMDPTVLPGGAGQKRRASSPPRNEGHTIQTVGSVGDLHRRRESASKASPSPRFQACGSFSSTASGIRTNSYASTLSYAPSSITSYGGRSPGGLSPATPDTAVDSPYATSMSLTSSPRVPIPSLSHQRAISDNRPIMPSRKASDGTSQVKMSGSRAQGLYICECCPKKPKKFTSQEELTLHEQEKQYVCTYCRNRFKNKNEAERHQNSLHLRRHSWSCAALGGYAAAFHPSPMTPNSADTCGYCGQDFPQTGLSSPNPLGQQVAIATDHDWEIRINHLQEVHKFGECNHAKKFFRADHFRQHLKHSHAGTSGKWTNMLETACMKDEPLPEPMRSPERIIPSSSGLGGRVDMISEEVET